MKPIAPFFLVIFFAVPLALGADTDKPTATNAIAFVETQSAMWTPGFTDAEKQTIFKIARDTMKWNAKGRKDKFYPDGYRITDKLKAKTAAVVSIMVDKKERMRKEAYKPDVPLNQQIHALTAKALASGGETNKLTSAELSSARLSITIMSPPQLSRGLKGFRKGAQGILIKKGPVYSGCLPRDPVENKWSLEEMMDALVAKTKYPKGSWQRATRYFFFYTVTLTESD